METNQTNNQAEDQKPTESQPVGTVSSVEPSKAVAQAVTNPSSDAITIDDLAKIEMRIGKVLSADPVEGSEKLLKLSVDFGEVEPRQVLSGIAKFVSIDELVGNIFPFVTNLPPRPMMGLLSQAMILAVNDDANFALLKPSKDIKPGTRLK